MAVKKIEIKEPNAVYKFSRKAALAYLGAFGVAGDELGKLFNRFVDRGERVQISARKMMRQNRKEVRNLAHEVQKEQKAALHRANKSMKKAAKRVEHALA